MSIPDSLDCLCTGIVVADFICQPIQAIPPSGGLARTERIEFSLGGCAANVAVDVSKLGIKVGISGRVGDDSFGHEVFSRLVSKGVDCRGLVKSSTAPTSTTFVLNVKGEDRRFIHSVGANAEYDGSDVEREQISSAKVLYVGGFGLMESFTAECVERLFRIARDARVTTILDVVLPEDRDMSSAMATVAPWTDYFFPNDDEGKRLSGESDPIRQARHFRNLGIQNVVITCGSRGSVVLANDPRTGNDAIYESGVYSVNPVDPTGTGDAFLSGYVYGMLKGASPYDCLRYGSAMGASCVRSMGATTGVFDQQELAEYAARHQLPTKMR